MNPTDLPVLLKPIRNLGNFKKLKILERLFLRKTCKNSKHMFLIFNSFQLCLSHFFFYSCVGVHRWPLARPGSVVGNPIRRHVPTPYLTRILSFARSSVHHGVRSVTAKGKRNGGHARKRPSTTADMIDRSDLATAQAALCDTLQ